MSKPQEHPPRAASVQCFFWTAPASAIAGGTLLLVVGEQALANGWSTVTMSLTHIATLGFISMTLLGTFYLLVPVQLDRRIKAPRLAYFVFVTFAIGIISLCIGLAGVAVTPVFVAIGALFPALGCFFWPAIGSLRGTRGQPNAAPLRLAIGAFLVVVILGIWVAHGHGGMKFPGPRGLWIQVHLAIALFGWIGGMSGAAFNWFSAEQSPEHGSQPLTSTWWGRLLWIGIVAPSGLLGLQYLGLVEMSQAATSWTASFAIAPAAIAAWCMQPFYGLRSLRNPEHPIAERHYWQSAFCLAPISLAIGAMALFNPTPQWRLAFAWVAIWGWAGLLVHAILRAFGDRGFAISSAARQEVKILDLAFPLHLLSIATGVAAIALGGPVLARLTGGILIALGVVQIHRMLRIAKAMQRVATG